jgi:hypothetical protein
MSKEEILKGLTDAVVRGDREASAKLSQDALAKG